MGYRNTPPYSYVAGKNNTS
ncbi:unnamed protein product [Acanthoscelides obtectus]|uniref:Uncharacterized protein n=1 Tax=Acanthoscelides obtectus TaxID=200917 RepID=A0A9P0NY17_ACAOB|nr:unnamed protein product [Acanthoscelides obtectus]CAK1641425.1 hypothetical protein AOBTE_LOCUS12394 [Acanthoscelides obtectus]